jgi:eukaryotic-like serine/threonine-protein kinase
LVPGELSPGALIDGKYRIERTLGRGGMGAVFLATHEGLDRKVAVKVLDMSIEHNPEAVERFKREGRVAAAIGHPGVVEVLDTGTTETGMPYLVMEYLEGPTLRQFFKRSGPLEAPLVAAIMLPVLDALHAAHQKDILHRDLKPANVLLAVRPRREVKLLDFGISKFLRSVTVITRTGVALGTPQYMSPEQMEGEKELTPAADLYAVGVLFFELLAGRGPFVADNEFQLMRQVVMGGAPLLQAMRPGLPPRLCTLVDALLRKHPQDRPASADDVRKILLEAVQPAEELLWSQVEQQLVTTQPHLPGPLRDRATPDPSLESVAQVNTVDLVPATTQHLAVKGPQKLTPIVIGGAVVAAAVTLVGVLGLSSSQPPSPPTRIAPAVTPVVVKRAVVEDDVMIPNPAAIPETEPEPPPVAPSEALLARADEALRQGDLVRAEELLRQCRVSGSPCPETVTKLQRVRDERRFKLLLDKAERAISEKKASQAVQLMGEAYGTEVFKARHLELEARLTDLMSQQMVAVRPPQPNPRPAPAQSRFELPSPSPGSSESEKLLSEAREHHKKLELAQAKTKLLGCLKLEPNNATCHKLLGSTYAMLKDNKKGVFHYKKFIELAPDDISAPKVKSIIEAYEASQK